MKPLVIYHANCADGFGAAFAAWLKLGDGAEYVPMAYGDLKSDWPMIHDREVYILDFSFPRPVMDQIFTDAKRVVWLDHHKTAFEMWCPHYAERGRFENDFDDHFITLDNNKSGAMLAWEYFHPGTEVPMLIQHTDDYDRWKFKIEGTKAFNKALWSYAPWSFEQWKREFLPADMGKPNLTFMQTSIYSALRKEGSAILRAHDQNVQSVVKGAARPCWITMLAPAQPRDEHREARWNVNVKGLAANCPPHLISDVGHELAVQSGTFGLCWCLSQEGMTAKCSLRSNGDYDVSAIAKAFGGGGHRNAAGFEVPIGTLLGWLK